MVFLRILFLGPILSPHRTLLSDLVHFTASTTTYLLPKAYLQPQFPKFQAHVSIYLLILVPSVSHRNFKEQHSCLPGFQTDPAVSVLVSGTSYPSIQGPNLSDTCVNSFIFVCLLLHNPPSIPSTDLREHKSSWVFFFSTSLGF